MRTVQNHDESPPSEVTTHTRRRVGISDGKNIIISLSKCPAPLCLIPRSVLFFLVGLGFVWVGFSFRVRNY